MAVFRYYLPTKITFGSGSLTELPGIIRKEFPKAERILLVTGRSFLQNAGKLDVIVRLLGDFTVVLFDKIEANPTSAMVHAGMEQFRKHTCDLIVAVGGGSTMDAAKAMAVLLRNDGTLEEYQKGREVENDPADLVAIPTTCGTSSEMTIWAVITNHEGVYRNTKKSLSDPKIYPKVAIIDPELMLSLPPYQTACTGLDALCHAIEGYFSRKRNPLSSVYALEAVKIIARDLPYAYEHGDDLAVRERMALGMLLAGFCFSNSRTSSPHKISYPLTTQFNLPHGAACAITLPAFMEYIGDHEPERLSGIVEALGCKDYREACNFLRQLIENLGLPNSLKKLGVEREDLEYIARKSYVPIEQQEDPVPIPYDTYVQILERAYE